MENAGSGWITSSEPADSISVYNNVNTSRNEQHNTNADSPNFHDAVCARLIDWVKVLRPKKGKCFPYSIPSVGPGADPDVQAVSPQVTVSHPPGGRLPLLSAMPAVTSPAAQYHRPLAGNKLYCLVTEAHKCEQLAQGCCAALPPLGFKPATY